MPLTSDETTSELNSLDGTPELSADDATELANDRCDDVVLDGPPELDPSPLPGDCGLNDDGCSERDAVNLNNYEDWCEFHQQEIVG